MRETSFCISPTQPILPTVKEQLVEFLKKHADLLGVLPREELLLCLVEAIQNARIHGGKHQEVRAALSVSNHELVMKVWDHNPPFLLQEKMQLPPDPYAESGRGLVIIQQLVDGLVLERYDDGNCLTLTKFLRPQAVAAKAEEDPLDLLYEVSESIVQAGEVNFDRIYQLVLDKAMQLFGVDRASIMNFDPEAGHLKIVASRGMPLDVAGGVQVKPGEGVSGLVFQEAKPVLIGGQRRSDSGYKSDSFISVPMLCSPMRMGETCIGVINVTERRDGRPFEEKDLKLLSTLANQAAAYVRIGHLIEQVKDSQRSQQELAWARRIQRSLLPQTSLRLPSVEAYGMCEMARQVGGDYFDYVQKGSYLYLIVADVSGHNLPAALTMVNFRSLLRSLISAEERPAQILEKVNAIIYNDLEITEHQITAALLRLDLNTQTMLYANAGHHPLLYLRKGAKEVERCATDGLLLGALPEVAYQELEFAAQPTDTLLFYTDGIVEATDKDGRPFGQPLLESLLIKYREFSPTLLITQLFKEVHRHIGSGRVADDDLTLMHVALR